MQVMVSIMDAYYDNDELLSTQCKILEESRCKSGGLFPNNYADRYADSSAAWVMLCAILMFFMKAGFLYMEQSFSNSDNEHRRRVVLAKYVDTFASTIGFWLFGYAISGNTSGFVLGERQDYIYWFFRFTFASNTATILGGTLVGHCRQMRIFSVFIYAFMMSSFINPLLVRWMWSTGRNEGLMFSPFRFCNGTRTVERDHRISNYSSDEDLGNFVFLDYAGSGVVHLCGGMAALVLQIFHKLECKKCKDCGCEYEEFVSFGVQPQNRRSSVYEETELMHSANSTEMTTSYQAIQAQDQPQDNQPQPSQIQAVSKTCGHFKRFIKTMYPQSGGNEFLESATLGVLILWTTWFGFNAGSTESIEGKIAHATVGRIALVMALAAASGGLTSVIISGIVQIKMKSSTNTNEIANGMLACLVAVTGCCPFIHPIYAVLIGVLTIFIYHFGCYILFVFQLHDGARVFPVHGLCGFWGVLCVGIFSHSCLIEEVYETACYCEELELPDTLKTQILRFLFQLTGALFIAVWSAVTCFLLFVLLKIIPVIWISEENELIDPKGNMLFAHVPLARSTQQ